MIKQGKIGRLNQKARKKIAILFEAKGINWCEKCGRGFGVAPAHRHNRVWYRRCPELLWSFKQVLALCIPCHQGIEGRREKTEALFMKLRGKED